MFETQFSIDQQELETQQSLPILNSLGSSPNIQLRIDSLESILRLNIQDDESSMNELGSQYGIDQGINDSIELYKQAQSLKDVVNTTYHPSILFGKKHYQAYQRLCWNELMGLNNIEELSEESFGQSQEIRNYVLSTLAQIQSTLINQDKAERDPAGDHIQFIIQESEDLILHEISLSSESNSDAELDNEQKNDVEQKIQNYNSNFNILEKFTAQYKSQSQIDNF
ncbi:unnamed protein product (macronuclear) [Paramecium tetraurelia]|uniref:Uncharacterized protein n=1 Tax=Paramecium tetraurelia TaxID=5888 RepID=A0BDH7_PARTE|nr:uncharacterized protein GSPATT00027622001 [Paramecium tetraurelia]CAK56594.1 unnamed protein product [Paramecium tetraurelia]|eukprot:XP_001423992.1 hypothetical protein (macronuclear) [Paramecium tetraurelia strain d4-2]